MILVQIFECIAIICWELLFCYFACFKIFVTPKYAKLQPKPADIIALRIYWILSYSGVIVGDYLLRLLLASGWYANSVYYHLQSLSCLCISGVNASYLGKHNAIPHIFKVMALCGRKHIPSLRLCLDIINNLSKSSTSLSNICTLLYLLSFCHNLCIACWNLNLFSLCRTGFETFNHVFTTALWPRLNKVEDFNQFSQFSVVI